MTREVKKDLQDRISYDQRFRRCIMYKSAIFACFRIRISNNDPIRTRFRSCVKKVNFDKFELENRFHCSRATNVHEKPDPGPPLFIVNNRFALENFL